MIFSHKHKSDITGRVSRLPYANFTLVPYNVVPKTKYLARDLKKHLKMLVKGSPESFDSLNGNAFDNIIDNWANKARAELENQRPARAETIKNLASARIANVKNAEDWIESDKKSLEEITGKIKKLESKERNEFV